MQLFDPAAFASPGDNPRAPKRQKLIHEAVLEPVVEPWTLVANRRGIERQQHLVKSYDPHMLSIRTACDIWGRRFDSGHPELDAAEKCPICVKEEDA